jgi:subfamily B ATP-binding cassette protein MsbA
MTRPGRLSFAGLLARYALPFWHVNAALIVLTLLSNLLNVVRPALLAGVLVGLVGDRTASPPQGSVFDLNHLGGRVLQWLHLSFDDVVGTLARLAVIYGLLGVVAAAMDYGAFLAANNVKVKASRRIQLDLLQHLLSLGLRFFHGQKSGELMSRLTHDATNTAVGLGPLIRSFVHHGTQIVVYGIYLYSTSLLLTVGAVGLLIVQFALTQVLRRPVRVLNRRLLDVLARFSGTLQEAFASVRIVKSFGSEGFELGKLRADIDRVTRTQLDLGRVEKLEGPARAALDSLAAMGILVLALGQLRSGSLTVQGLLLYLYVGQLMITPINHVATTYLWVQALLAGFARVNDLFAERPEVVDGPLSKRGFDRSILVKHVSFSYGPALALEDVSLEIGKGQVVALVGPSGAGKSTLSDLILRLYDPDAGGVFIDGIDVRDLKQKDYRRLFGVVSQESLLFHDTVRNNIRYGRAELSEEEIYRAARIANAHDFIMELPLGYDTLVGDRGVKLSGGQRQRIAIARAIVSNPPILVLDEATSSLDSESERQVQEAIDRIIEDSTALVIAHRLSTVVHADKIIVLDRRRVVDQGRHDELLRRCELYRHLTELQVGFDRPSAVLAGG